MKSFIQHLQERSLLAPMMLSAALGAGAPQPTTPGTETEVKTVEGMQFDRGYLSPYFVTNSEKMIAELENP